MIPQPAYAALDFRPLPLPHTEAAPGQIPSLPIFPELTEGEATAFADALCQLRPR